MLRASVMGALVLLTAASAVPARAAEPDPAAVRRHTLGNSRLRDLPRASNGRNYMLYVGLPSSYGTEPARRYPVVYLCDGYWDFTLVSGFYGNLIYDKAIPEAILVGIGYPGESPDYDTLRRFDYTPVPDPEKDAKGETSGHAAEFLGALEKDIIPFVEREYRADSSYRVLGGSSLGGLFALYAMYAKPGLFQAYIAPSPAVVWANDWLFGMEKTFAASGQPLTARLFMSGAGAEDARFLAGIQAFNSVLEKRAYKGLQYEWRLVDGERHAGTKAESFNRGLRFAFVPLAPRPPEPPRP